MRGHIEIERRAALTENSTCYWACYSAKRGSFVDGDRAIPCRGRWLRGHIGSETRDVMTEDSRCNSSPTGRGNNPAVGMGSSFLTTTSGRLRYSHWDEYDTLDITGRVLSMIGALIPDLRYEVDDS